MLTFSLTLLPKIISFLFLAAILALYLKRKSLPSVLVRLGIIASLIFFVYLGFAKTLFTYIAWSQNEFSKYFLPPTTPISYFANYSFFRFWLGLIIAAAMALLIFGFLIFLKKKRPILLDKEDASLAAFGALVSGWPGLIIFFPSVLLMMIFWHLFVAIGLSLRGAPPRRNDEAISPSAFSVPNRYTLHASAVGGSAYGGKRFPIAPFIFIAAFSALLFSSYVLKYLGLDVLIPAKSAG